MVLINPTGVKAQGARNVIWVPTFTSYIAPTATETNAVGALDITCFLTPDGWGPSIDTNKGAAPRRLCTTVETDQFGNTKYTMTDLVFAVDPQAASGADPKKAWTALTDGSAGYFVDRQGLTSATAVAAAQFVDVWPVKLGIKLIQGDTTDEFAEYLAHMAVIVTGPPKINVALLT